jgi:hypothetical protein
MGQNAPKPSPSPRLGTPVGPPRRQLPHRQLRYRRISTIDVKVLRKACFGSYGCNVTYEIDPTYTGATPLTGRTFTVIYEVTGSECGPLISNFAVNSDGTASLSGQDHPHVIIRSDVEGQGNECGGGPIERLRLLRHLGS